MKKINNHLRVSFLAIVSGLLFLTCIRIAVPYFLQ